MHDQVSVSVPGAEQFEAWLPEQVEPLAREKTVVFAPGGTSRWYFLEHGRGTAGYSQEEQFSDYAYHALHRAVELADLMFQDGVRTVFIVGFVPGQDARTEDYNRNVARSFDRLVDASARDLYQQHQIGVLFRGGWEEVFERSGRRELAEACADLEQTAPQSDRRLIWLASEAAVVPRSMLLLLMRHFESTGEILDRHTLCHAYYGRPIEHVDIFIGHNKTSMFGLMPPLMTVGDVYFTVNPSYYMDRRQWRSILYDHCFARGKHYRDYARIDPAAFEELRQFYESVQGMTIGVGERHEATQSWRPKWRNATEQP